MNVNTNTATISKYIEVLPVGIRDTVTIEDDSNELFVAEISEAKWNYFISNYPIYIMEIEGSDPLFEQYLIQRQLELRNRILMSHNKDHEKELKSSFEAANQINQQEQLKLTIHNEKFNELHQSSLEKSVLSSEEIIILEEMSQLQQQVILYFYV